MVGEFPELQGTMGTYYARHDGEADERGAGLLGDTISRASPATRCPEGTVSTAVALADKLETLVGIWGIGLQPTGEKDPFALRRHALGILRMLIERPLAVPLDTLLATDRAGVRGDRRRSKPSREAITGASCSTACAAT